MPPKRKSKKITSKQQSQQNTLAAADEFELTQFTPAYLSQAFSTTDLCRRLKNLHESLREMPNQMNSTIDDKNCSNQANYSFIQTSICPVLFEEAYLHHHEKDVRLLIACCFVDLLRISAPEIPFTDDQDLFDAFKLILPLLRGINLCGNQEDSQYLRCLYLLESLAEVKSCLLVVGLRDADEKSRREDKDECSLLLELFQCLFESICEDHSSQVESYVLTILQNCLEECDPIPTDIIECIFSQILSRNQRDKSYHIAVQIIQKSAQHLQAPISKYFNQILVDHQRKKDEQTELSEHIYDLIYQVHKIDNSLLLYVLPNVCMQLQVDEQQTRHNAIALMGRLFASSHADYGSEFLKNFRDFLGRFRDRAKDIRLQMIQVGAIILERKPELRDAILKELQLRLTDPEWEVRRRAVNELCDVAATDVTILDESTLQAIGERMKDKKIVLRKEAMTGLAQIYAQFLLAQDNEDYFLSPSLSTRLEWIPTQVLKCYAYPEAELKLRTIQLLDEILIPKQFDMEARVRRMFFVIQSLDPQGMEALRRIWFDREKGQERLAQYLNARGSSTTPFSEITIASSSNTLGNIVDILAEDIPLLELRQQLHQSKDGNVFKNLRLISSAGETISSQKKARDALIKSVGSKSALGEALKGLCRRLMMNSAISIDSISIFMELTIEEEETCGKTGMILLEILSKRFPCLIQSVLPHLESSILQLNEEDHENRSTDMLQILVNCIHATSSAPSITLSKSLTKHLKQMCFHGSAEEARLASKCLIVASSSLTAHHSIKILELTRRCSWKSTSSSGSDQLQSTLETLNTVVKNTPERIEAVDAKTLYDFLLHDFLFCSEAELEHNTEALARREDWNHLRCSAIKVVRNMLVYLHPQQQKTISTTTSSSVMDNVQHFIRLMFDVIQGRVVWGKKVHTTSKKTTQSKQSNLNHQQVGLSTAGFRALCAASILKLMGRPDYEKLLSVSQWHALGQVVEDANELVRHQMLQSIQRGLVQRHKLPLKYLSLVVLMAQDPNPVLRKEARQLLLLGIKKLRHLCSLHGASSSSSASKQHTMSLNANSGPKMVPEYLLPYAVHLIAHHPKLQELNNQELDDFQNGDSNSNEHQEAVAGPYLAFLLDGLVAGTASEVDNISFLLQILDTMSKCEDAVTTQSSSSPMILDHLIGWSIDLLKKKIKTQRNLKPYPGKIFLPTTLYRLRRAAAGAANVSLLKENVNVGGSSLRRDTNQDASSSKRKLKSTDLKAKKGTKGPRPRKSLKASQESQSSRTLPSRKARIQKSMADSDSSCNDGSCSSDDDD